VVLDSGVAGCGGGVREGCPGGRLATLLKKPFDLVELFENKLSALVAAGAFVL